MSFFDQAAPLLAQQAFNPAFATPTLPTAIPKAASNFGGAAVSPTWNPGPTAMLNALSNMQNVSGENQLRAQQARQAQISTDVLQQQAKAAMQPAPPMYSPGIGAATAPAAPVAAPSQTGDPLDAYADRVISLESGGDPNAKNPKSSAAGPGGFTDATWLGVARQHFPATAQMGDQALMSLRTDKDFSRQMVKAYAQDNAGALSDAGLPVTAGNLYAAHFLGAGGATKVLSADPGTPLASLLPAQVMTANPSLKGQTAGVFAANMALKMGTAPGQAGQVAQANTGTMNDAGQPAPPSASPTPAQSPGAPQNPNDLFARQIAQIQNGNPGTPNGVPSAPSLPALPGQQINPAAIEWAQQQDRLNSFMGRRNPTAVDNILALAPGGANDPNTLFAKQLAQAQANKRADLQYAALLAAAQKGIDLQYAGPIAGATANATNASELQYKPQIAGAVATAQRQAAPPILRQGSVLPVADPDHPGQFKIGMQAPILPEGTSLGTGPNGEPSAVPVQGALPAIQDAERAKKLGAAQVQPLVDQNEVLKGEYEKNVVEPFNHAQDALEPLTAIQNAMQNYTTGPGAQTKLQAMKAWQTAAPYLGIDPGSQLGKEIASGEVINKEGNTLGFALARSLGSREAQSIVQQAIQSNPGLANSPQGNVQLIGLIKQGLQRDIDKRGYVDNFMQQHGTFAGATNAFNQTNPVESYISRAVPYQPKTEQDYNALMPGVTYFNPNTQSYKVKGSNAPANQPTQ